MIKKWTIGIVNFNSSVYLNYILKTLYEFNDPSDFNVVVVDNSNPHEKEDLDGLAKIYAKYDNFDLVYHTPKAQFPSGQHGEALNVILNKTKTKFLMVQDPDFFWVKRNYLNILESYFKKGCLAIGAPYRDSKKIFDGDRNFPAAFGCAYLVSSLQDVDFYPSEDLVEVNDLGKDVGWKIRQKLSGENFISFEQKKSDIHSSLGKFSYDVNPYEYILDGEKLCYHLFKGSRGDFIPQKAKKGYDGTNQEGYKQKEMLNIRKVRDRYGRYFYNLAKNNADSNLNFLTDFIKKIFLKIRK